MVEGGFGAKIGPAVDCHRVGDLKFVVVGWSSETVGAIGDGGDRGRHRGDRVTVEWVGWMRDGAKIFSCTWPLKARRWRPCPSRRVTPPSYRLRARAGDLITPL